MIMDWREAVAALGRLTYVLVVAAIIAGAIALFH